MPQSPSSSFRSCHCGRTCRCRNEIRCRCRDLNALLALVLWDYGRSLRRKTLK